jgi:hypothetical protein
VRRASVTVGLLSLGAESNTLKRYKLSTACAVPLPIHAGLNRLDAEWSALDLTALILETAPIANMRAGSGS